MDDKDFHGLIEATKEGKRIGHDPHHVAFGYMTGILEFTDEQRRVLFEVCRKD